MKTYQNVTDFDIQALVDNQLPPEKAADVRNALEADMIAKARYEMLCRQKELLQRWARGAFQNS